MQGQGLTVVEAAPEEDAGVYECIAFNDVGHTGSRTTVQVTQPENISQIKVVADNHGDPALSENRRQYIASSVLAARESIETAVEDTVMKILKSGGKGGGDGHPSSLLQVFKDRNSTARQLATAGEVFERTLALINRHVRAGHNFDSESMSSSSKNNQICLLQNESMITLI
jgi:hypothetical protein